MNGISSVTDSPRPGQSHRVVTPEGIAAVEAIMKENRHVTVNEIAAHLDMSHGSAHHIVRDVLQFHKVFNKLRDKKYLRFSSDLPSYKALSTFKQLTAVKVISHTAHMGFSQSVTDRLQ